MNPLLRLFPRHRLNDPTAEPPTTNPQNWQGDIIKDETTPLPNLDLGRKLTSPIPENEMGPMIKDDTRYADTYQGPASEWFSHLEGQPFDRLGNYPVFRATPDPGPSATNPTKGMINGAVNEWHRNRAESRLSEGLRQRNPDWVQQALDDINRYTPDHPDFGARLGGYLLDKAEGLPSEWLLERGGKIPYHGAPAPFLGPDDQRLINNYQDAIRRGLSHTQATEAAPYWDQGL